MKKFFVTILAVIYLATSAGATITLHYCMGTLSSVDMVHKDACNKCGMKKVKGCCEDKAKVIKVQDSHQSVNQVVDFPFAEATLKNDYSLPACDLRPVMLSAALHNNSPPGSASTSLYIFHCHFSI